MEKLKSSIPSELKRIIYSSTPGDLPSTCSSLVDFFLSTQLFHTVVSELADPKLALCSKNINTASDFKNKANASFSSRHYQTAISLYSQALRYAPINTTDDDASGNEAEDVSLVAKLYVNRAASLHKMGLYKESLRDCDRAVLLSPRYSKAWYRRGKANASLGNYQDSIRDLNASINVEVSPTAKSWIKKELDLISKDSQRTSSSLTQCDEKNFKNLVEPCQIELQCISTPAKGRGLASFSNISEASLLHFEEPYAAIVLKHCRETHCHFCLNELSPDTVPCPSCSIPLYCSEQCQLKSGGQISMSNINNIHGDLPADVEKYITGIFLDRNSVITVGGSSEWIAEHKHECGGVHWPIVFPSEIVLAGRVLVKSIEQKKQTGRKMKSIDCLDLSHNYISMDFENKLDLHIYSLILTYCLQHSYGAQFPLTGIFVAQLVILICQIKVNSMAVVHMKSVDSNGSLVAPGKFSHGRDTLTNIEQVRVGQAIYATASLFNHSCQPNIHAYFLSRTLFIRSTEFVVAGCPLELSYGPQVGQWDRKARQQLLQDRYAFKCQCSGCSELNVCDLVIGAFSCERQNCLGATLSYSMINQDRVESYCTQDVSSSYFLDCPIPVDQHKREGIRKVARCLIENKDGAIQISPGYCLNCGSFREPESSLMKANNAKSYMERLRGAIATKEIPANILVDALRALDILKSTMHAYSKEIAQAEDNLAEAFCLIGDFERAMPRCKASIQILEKLYHPKHIIIGNELVKLASIQLCLDEHQAIDSINQLSSIFSVYYGSHAPRIFQYLDNIKQVGKC